MRRKDWDCLIGTVKDDLTFVKFLDDKNFHVSRDAVLCKCNICNEEFKISKICLVFQRDIKCCPTCARRKVHSLDINPRTKFGRLVVVESGEPHKETSGKYSSTSICKCECGNYIIVKNNILKQGETQSCGCLRGDNMLKEIKSGTIINYLKIISSGVPIIRKDGKRNSTSICECLLCGKICTIANHSLKSERTKSCGCLTSKGERLTQLELNKYNIEISKQYSFPDLKSIKDRRLKFDFAILKGKQLIALLEFQGEQHIKNKGIFGKEQREITDKQKKEYCYKNDIPLYEIWFNDDIEKRVKEILIELKLIE